MKKKTVALLLALVLVFGVAAGGTLAWLTAETTPVKNTFTTSDIKVKLEESENLDLKMIPGWTITKDPKAWVEAGSEDCYLFVKLEKSASFNTYLSYEVDTSDGEWTKLNGVTDEVYYRIVKADEMGTSHKFSVLKDDKVTVSGSVTKEMMNGLKEKDYPTLTVTAYASQLYKSNTETFTPEVAWTNINSTAPAPTT